MAFLTWNYIFWCVNFQHCAQHQLNRFRLKRQHVYLLFSYLNCQLLLKTSNVSTLFNQQRMKNQGLKEEHDLSLVHLYDAMLSLEAIEEAMRNYYL